MKLFAPTYYKKFKCKADACRHSCCVGWDIYLDGGTLRKYQTLDASVRERMLSYIDAESGKITLRADGRCPYLMESGLCSVISEMGDEYLCDICREHPRFYNFYRGRAEVGLGASCEEAARLILSEDIPEFVQIGEIDHPCDDFSGFDSTETRDEIYEILSDKDLNFSSKIKTVCYKLSIPEEAVSALLQRDFSQELEMLCEEHREIFKPKSKRSEGEFDKYLERALAYFIYRHLGDAENRDNQRARIALCILLTYILENSLKCKDKVTFSDVCDLFRIISEEIEYSEENTEYLIFELEYDILSTDV